MVIKRVYNKYDTLVFLLVFSLLAGAMPGLMQLSRTLAILFIPFLSSTKNYIYEVRRICKWLIIWSLLAVFSLIWTRDFSSGLDEVIGIAVYSLLFSEIVIFAQKAFSPRMSIAYGWVVGMFFSVLIALWELNTGNHLSMTKFADNHYFNDGGIAVLHTFASVTFGNYNGYVVYICFGMPFVLCAFIKSERLIEKIVLVFSILASLYVMFMNASRGGLLTLAILLFSTFAFGKNMGLKARMKMFGFLVIILLFVVTNWEVLSFYINVRTEGGTESVQDEVRWEIWGRAIKCFFMSPLLGTGAGSIVECMKSVSPAGSVVIPHNVLLEILVQYGIVIGFIVCKFFYTLVKGCAKFVHDNTRILLLASLATQPFTLIIDSAYLRNPAFWVFFASLYVWISQNYSSLNKNRIEYGYIF